MLVESWACPFMSTTGPISFQRQEGAGSARSVSGKVCQIWRSQVCDPFHPDETHAGDSWSSQRSLTNSWRLGSLCPLAEHSGKVLACVYTVVQFVCRKTGCHYMSTSKLKSGFFFVINAALGCYMWLLIFLKGYSRRLTYLSNVLFHFSCLFSVAITGLSTTT